MRYLVGFVFVLALAVAACGDTSFCAFKPDRTPCTASTGEEGSCYDGECCYTSQDPDLDIVVRLCK